MYLGQAMYDQQQAEHAQAEPGADAGAGGEAGEQPAGDEEVVDAEFSEVDEENKGS